MNRRLVPRSPRALRILLVAAPAIGMVYFAVVYLAAEAGCSIGLDAFGTTALRVVIFAATGAAIAVLIGVAVWAHGLLHAREQVGDGHDDPALPRFVAETALILSAVFLFFVLIMGAPAIGSDLCSAR